MTIRHRITLLIVLMFVALLAIGGYAVYQTRGSAVEVRQVTQGVVPSALASADLVSQVKDVQLATMELVYAPDPNLVAQAQEELKTKKSALQAALALQAKGATSHAQVGLVAEAKDSLENYFSAINDTAAMKAAGKNELAQANLFANVAQYRDEFEQIVDTLRVEKNREKDQAITVLNGTLATTTVAIASVTGIAIILLTLVGTLLYRQIIRPLSRMQAMMSEIAASQDFTRRVPVGRMDELGHSTVAFNGMIAKIQENSLLLKQKTADIQAMLQNMQQGILTVVEGAANHGAANHGAVDHEPVIHAEYSAYLETIFETRDIAGRGLMDFVFAHTDLGADALSQVDAASQACLGEDAMNFEFNQHLLVNEIEKRMPDGRVKILDLSWSAITDDSDTIVRLMLCVRDVTELRELAAEADEQRRRLEMIGEILAVSQEKFHQFIEGSTEFISENERIIRKHTQANGAAIAELFRNMHTIKGNARTYNLQHLTDVVHEMEQSYDELRQPNANRAWDQEGLMQELARVKEAVQHYAKINEISLGRKGPGSRGSAERYLMVDKLHIRNSLRLLEATDSDSPSDLISMRDAVRQTLRLLGTESLGEALSDVLKSLPSLAQDLGKSEPLVRIADNGYRLRSQAVEVLKNVFTHLLRNSMDHGLESAEVRSAQGKAPAGTIEIEVGIDQGQLQITLSDDGQGLALGRIRAIALERGWIAADEELGDEALAHLIFRPGFSTATQVTAVSGRGVGMDAVQDFLKREQGTIELHFTDERKGAQFRQFQTVVCLPDSFAVDSVGTPAASDADASHPDASHLDAMAQ